MAFNIHLLIDRTPELPYFILAVIYLLGRTDAQSVHVFSMVFLFVMTSLALGLLLKALFKTKRPKRHYDLPALRYDFPSLHSMISIGTIVFVYYVDPSYSLVLVPVGLFYLYSRVKLKAHSVGGCFGGAFIGAALGFLFGSLLDRAYLPEGVEMLLAVLLFCTPLLTTVFRMKYASRMDF
jgi:membrane-associated phospholipid phosphatase